MAIGPGRDPDGGGADPSAWYVQPRGTDFNESFAEFTSDEPYRRLQAAYVAASARRDPRAMPALLDRLQWDPNPVVRKVIASRMLTPLAHDPQVRSALQATAVDDEHPGVRWAARYALHLNPDHEPGA